MDQLPISELNPELPALELKQFRAVVTLIWPYSSSARQFALLLAEPDFRLRRKKGQVRARFSGSCAKAVATTGVGIGDEVILSLRGAQFVQEGTVSTPGKSIDWELSYTQTVVVQVFRSGSETANLELVNVAPTPAPRSPVRQPVAALSPAQQWSSPAFLKRVRLSDGPFFEAPYDPLTDGHEEGHDKKRRRKSYRDWKAWTYSARTPSPEKDGANLEEDSDVVEPSPSRPTRLPHTPVSPAKPEELSGTAGALDRIRRDEEDHQLQAGHRSLLAADQAGEVVAAYDNLAPRPKQEDFVRDADYYELYAGPNEFPPSDKQYAFGGDTEVDTEVNTEEEDAVQDGLDVVRVSVSTTEANTQSQEYDQLHHSENDDIEVESAACEQDFASGGTENRVEVDKTTAKDLRSLGGALPNVMPPPTLPTLQTDIPAIRASARLTPTGREPPSPTLQPLDSATLPLPSPFPGGCNIDAASSLDHVTSSWRPTESEAAVVEEQEPPSDASYILETSFFSSINSSKASAFHPNHESAFTPVRFTFGMDGAGFSQPVELSSPAPKEPQIDTETEAYAETSISLPKNAAATLNTRTSTTSLLETSNSDTEVQEVEATINARLEDSLEQIKEPGVIMLSSPSEADKSEESETDSDMLADDKESLGDEHMALASDQDQAEVVEETTIATDIEQADTAEPQDSWDLLNRDKNGLASTYQSTTTSAIIDLGSPSEDHSDEEELVAGIHANDTGKAGTEGGNRQPASGTRRSPTPDRYEAPSQSADIGSHSEFVNMDFAPELSHAISNSEGRSYTHTQSQQGTYFNIDSHKEEQLQMVDDHEPQLAMSDTNDYMQDLSQFNEPSHAPEWELPEVEERHPEVKMESIEEASLFQTSQPDVPVVQDSPDELLIAVPDEGHKVGELQTISVPATGPARNTRSRTKPTKSPTDEKTPDFKRGTRSTRSKTSTTSVARTALSPSRMRTRSPASPSQDNTQTTPYSLRSQSKLRSPTKGTFISATGTRSNLRKHASERSVDSILDIGSSSLEDQYDPFITSFKPSQELGASQGRYSNVSFVKDSEEESLRSKHSISTVQHSDDWNTGVMHTYTNLSDPVEHTAQDDDLTPLKPPPASAPEAKTKTGAKKGLKKTGPQVVIQTKSSSPARPIVSFNTKPSPSSPSTRLRSTTSTEVASPSPRNIRRTRRHVYDLSSEPEEPVDDMSDTTPRAYQEVRDLTYPALPGEGEGEGEGDGEGDGEENRSRSSPPPPPSALDIDEIMRSSPPLAASAFPLTDQRYAMDRNRLITPEATQQTNIESQPDFTTGQPQQGLPMTPQLTQAMSAGFRSFQTNDIVNIEDVATATVVKTPPITKSTPRRNVTEVDVASASASPKNLSSDIDSESALEQPSIGLSTPLAYYTPLKDLIYFLNRSSQFHSSANPDILALVTSGTTASQKATKGPKHWNTTLHITDLSTWPTTTTVNVFRAYQTALPHADAGDIVLLRAFAVKSLNRHPTLISADESSWCVWRYGKPIWGAKRGAFGEIRAREETKGPSVEKGEGEWREVGRLRDWYVNKVKAGLEEKEQSQVKTRSRDKGREGATNGSGEELDESGVTTRSRDKGKARELAIEGDAEA